MARVFPKPLNARGVAVVQDEEDEIEEEVVTPTNDKTARQACYGLQSPTRSQLLPSPQELQEDGHSMSTPTIARLILMWFRATQVFIQWSRWLVLYSISDASVR